MPTTVGIGRSTRRDAIEAGREAAQLACESLGGTPADLFIVFATAGYQAAELLSGIRESSPGAALVGCSGEGIITRGLSDESDRTLGVLALASDRLKFDTFLVPQYSADPAGVGAELARQVAAAGRDDAFALLLFPDGLLGNCTELLRTLTAALPDSIRVAGGTAGDSLTFEGTYQYCRDTAIRDGVAAVLISGKGSLEVAVSHGCMPLGLERHVTESSDGWVQKIDGEPAWSVFRQYLEGEPEDLNTEGSIHLSVGEPSPPDATGEYEPFIIRTPMGLNKENGALFFPGGGITQGGALRMTRRDPLRVRTSARECAERIAKRRVGQSPAFVIQFDCAGRGKQLFGSRTSEAIVTPLQEAFASDTAWLGFHTYGEIAPVGGATFYHNLTVALCAIYENPAA